MSHSPVARALFARAGGAIFGWRTTTQRWRRRGGGANTSPQGDQVFFCWKRVGPNRLCAWNRLRGALLLLVVWMDTCTRNNERLGFLGSHAMWILGVTPPEVRTYCFQHQPVVSSSSCCETTYYSSRVFCILCSALCWHTVERTKNRQRKPLLLVEINTNTHTTAVGLQLVYLHERVVGVQNEHFFGQMRESSADKIICRPILRETEENNTRTEQRRRSSVGVVLKVVARVEQRRLRIFMRRPSRSWPRSIDWGTGGSVRPLGPHYCTLVVRIV